MHQRIKRLSSRLRGQRAFMGVRQVRNLSAGSFRKTQGYTGLLQPLGIHIHQRHLSASLQEVARTRAANAPGTTRHKHVPVLKFMCFHSSDCEDSMLTCQPKLRDTSIRLIQQPNRSIVTTCDSSR